jgi:hypothetical protein
MQVLFTAPLSADSYLKTVPSKKLRKDVYYKQYSGFWEKYFISIENNVEK